MNTRKRHRVQLIVVADKPEQRDLWMNTVRIRICPWDILYDRFKRELLDTPLSQDMLDLITGSVRVGKTSDKDGVDLQPPEIMDKIQKVKILPEAIDMLSAFVHTVANFVKTCCGCGAVWRNFQ